MHLIVDGKITIQNANITDKTVIKNHLTIINPQYQMAMRMAEKDASKKKMLWAIPKEFKYYKELGDNLIVGRGLSGFLSQRKVDFTLENKRVSPKMDNPLEEKLQLRSYQVGRATKALKYYQGILKLGTAWGKTIFAFRLAEKTQLKTLIVCCKAEANELHKYKQDFKKIYGKDIGVIQGKTFNIKDVTVATASTLCKRDVSKVADTFGMVIIDECHVGMSEKRLETFQQFNCERFYGMSGTPGRANGQGKALDFYYGPIILDEKLPQDLPKVEIYKSNIPIIGTEFYEMEEFVAESEQRNNDVATVIFDLANIRGRKVLVLTKRIEHGITLKKLLNATALNVLALSSKDKASMRSELIQALRSEEKDFDVLIGTYGLFSTGIDIPRLDAVLLAMSTKVDGDYDATLVQSVGRVLRLHDKKKKPLVVDIDDTKNKIMHRHFNSRLALYKREGWKMTYK